MTERRARYKTTRNTSKQRSRHTVINGVEFDSEAEGRRYLYLLAEQQAGNLSNLEPHPVYQLHPAFIAGSGERIRAMHYTADFRYTFNGRIHVEDVKAFYNDKRTGKRKPLITEDARLKIKLFQYQHPEIWFEITEA